MDAETEARSTCDGTNPARPGRSRFQKTDRKGAKLLTGGNRFMVRDFSTNPRSRRCAERVTAYREEVFGPIWQLFSGVSNADAAVELERHPFGLGSSAWTKIAKEQKLFRIGVDSGMVSSRDGRLRSASLPFGGVKTLRFWSRNWALQASRNSTNTKTIWISERAASVQSLETQQVLVPSCDSSKDPLVKRKAVSLVTKRFVKLVGIFLGQAACSKRCADSSLGKSFSAVAISARPIP